VGKVRAVTVVERTVVERPVVEGKELP
jgi:hypothetical protein